MKEFPNGNQWWQQRRVLMTLRMTWLIWRNWNVASLRRNISSTI
jgi:hypothetical protein